MARNPELDHEFREGKQQEKKQTIIFQDHDNYSEPLEQLSAIKEISSGTKSLLLKMAGGILVMLIIGFIWYLLSVTGVLSNY